MTVVRREGGGHSHTHCLILTLSCCSVRGAPHQRSLAVRCKLHYKHRQTAVAAAGFARKQQTMGQNIPQSQQACSQGGTEGWHPRAVPWLQLQWSGGWRAARGAPTDLGVCSVTPGPHGDHTSVPHGGGWDEGAAGRKGKEAAHRAKCDFHRECSGSAAAAPEAPTWFLKQRPLFQVEVKEGGGAVPSESMEEAALQNPPSQEPCKFPSSQDPEDAAGSSQKEANTMVTLPRERLCVDAGPVSPGLRT